MGLIIPLCWLFFGLSTIIALFVAYERRLRFLERSEERKAAQVSKDYKELSSKIERIEERINRYMIGKH
jgi:Na+/alanine symporter